MTHRIAICLDDPETRAVWDAAVQAKAEVAAWPAWKLGAVQTTQCYMCGYDPTRVVAREWTIAADGVLPSANTLGGNGRKSYGYRKHRNGLSTLLGPQLGEVPRANKFRVGVVTRYYGARKRKYDTWNGSAGCKALIDVLVSYAVLISDAPSAFQGHYLQKRSGDGVDRFTVRLIEYA